MVGLVGDDEPQPAVIAAPTAAILPSTARRLNRFECGMSGPLCKASACRIEQIVHDLRRARTVALSVLRTVSPTESDRAPRFCHMPALCYHAIDGMRIALAQINPISGDISGNTARILDAVRDASAQKAELVVTPEMALPGYCIGDLVEDAEFLEANERAMQAIAAAARGITAVVGFVDVDASAKNDNGTSRKYNAAAVVRDGRILQRARKSLLPELPVLRRQAVLHPGRSARPVDVAAGRDSVRLGVSICEDMWDEFYDVKPLAELSGKGASILLNLNASPFYPGKRHIRDRLIRAHIRRLGKPIVYVNTVGAADNGKNIIPFDGESLVYDAGGRLVAIGRQFAEELMVVDIGPEAADRRRSICPPSIASARCTTRW